MNKKYPGVTTRFLNDKERLILSAEHEMPLVIEPVDTSSVPFLQEFLANNSAQILNDIAIYGAVLLRGFDIKTDEDFEKSVLSIKGFKGISEAFMSEEGRIHVGDLKYILHTNAVYKTGGTLYLGGFHSENYYGTDVPAYISFCCLTPSIIGGETGMINMEKIYQCFSEDLKAKLAKNSFFVCKWLITDVQERYQIPMDMVEKICQHFDLPIIGEGKDRFVLLYKPGIFEHPITNKSSLQINLFELPTLNAEMRKCFMDDYQGKTWFWHRFVWRLPTFVLKMLEYIYIMCASFFYSPKNATKIFFSKLRTLKASLKAPAYPKETAGNCFNELEVKELAQLIRNYYSSCLWKKGDILLIDNRKVMHAGMPGTGPRLVRALIGNPIAMNYSWSNISTINCTERTTETVGHYMQGGHLELDNKVKTTQASSVLRAELPAESV